MRKIKSKKLIVIVGLTASGKSGLAIKLARKIGGEIISADSRQVYKRMDIGTGKVTKDEQKLVKHRLLDVFDPKKEFTAAHFKKLGGIALDRITQKNKIPVIVGGTGFYIDVLLNRVNLPEVPPNKKLRAQFDKLTAEKLYERLGKLDPFRAKEVDAKNKRRLIRALEIVISTGRPVLVLSPLRPISYDILWLGITWPKKTLAKRIKIRLDKRLEQGMIGEIQKLHRSGVSWKRLDNFGLEYRQVSNFLKSSKSKIRDSKSQIQNFKLSEYYKKLLAEIIRYSKRQMTWFKKNKEIHWVRNCREAEKLAKKFLE